MIPEAINECTPQQSIVDKNNIDYENKGYSTAAETPIRVTSYYT